MSNLQKVLVVPSCVVPKAQDGRRDRYIELVAIRVPKGFPPGLGSMADCSDSKGLCSASMGRNNTFKERKHSYKAVLAVKIRWQ